MNCKWACALIINAFTIKKVVVTLLCIAPIPSLFSQVPGGPPARSGGRGRVCNSKVPGIATRRELHDGCCKGAEQSAPFLYFAR